MTKTKPTIQFNFGGLLAVAAGGYLLWANRFKIQRFLEAQGINTPWMTNNFGEAVQSGAAKVAGSVEHAFTGGALANNTANQDLQ